MFDIELSKLGFLKNNPTLESETQKVVEEEE